MQDARCRIDWPEGTVRHGNRANDLSSCAARIFERRRGQRLAVVSRTDAPNSTCARDRSMPRDKHFKEHADRAVRAPNTNRFGLKRVGVSKLA